MTGISMRRAHLMVLVLLLLTGIASSQEALIVGVGPVGLTVSDMDRSLDFYTRVLPFRKISDTEVAGPEIERAKGIFGVRARIVRLQLGDEQLELTEFVAPRGRAMPEDSRSNDRWFQHVAIIVRDMQKAYAHLRQHRVVHASSGPQRLPEWNRNAAGIQAFYFRDPDGHHLEVLSFPAGKGDPKWHRPGTDLFLGIDHTAIVVGDTEASLAFYRDVLGMKVIGESENHGIEQEHLNNVFGARLRIIAVRAASGPAIEFLEYLAPRGGRPYPTDARPNDLLHWETHLLTNSGEAAWDAMRKSRAPLISSEPQPLHGSPSVFLIRDPDGHALSIFAAKE